MVPNITRIAFTPIIPHPATEYDTINTTMKNFQDVLLQKNLQYGPLWCDEGVYRLAKELQLLNPDGFSNIFLGLGGFHTEKVLIACCGKFLENIGIDSVLVENEIFGPAVVNTVLNVDDCCRFSMVQGSALSTSCIPDVAFYAFHSALPFGGSLLSCTFLYCDIDHFPCLLLRSCYSLTS